MNTIPPLSEAGLLGAMIRPQSYLSFYEHYAQTSCFMGAAMEAIGVPITTMTREEMTADAVKRIGKAWNWMLTPQRCPHGKCKKRCRVDNLIYHVNNRHKWTRERMAAWIATIEPQEAPVGEEAACQTHSMIG